MKKLNLSTRKSTLYYIAITVCYLILLFVLPDGYWNYTPLVYILVGPVTFWILYSHSGSRLSSYVRENHPDLMVKYAIHYGVRKGEVLNLMNAVVSSKEFHSKDDRQLSQLMMLCSHNLKFIVISFVSVLFSVFRILAIS